MSEEEEAPGWSILPSMISEMESEDEEKDSKAAPTPTIEGEVPCASPLVDEDNGRYDRIKIICDPTTTSMKIPMTYDEDTASYCYRRPLPHNPTRRPNNYSNDRARSPSLLGLVMGLYLPPS